MAGVVGHAKRCRGVESHRVRDLRQARRRRNGVFGESTVDEGWCAEDSIANGNIRDARANLVHDAGDLHTGCERERRLLLILAAA